MTKENNTVVWTEIPATDFERATKFYEGVLNASLNRDNTGPNPLAFLPAVNEDAISGHIYPGKPAPKGTGATIHLTVDCSLDVAKERITKAGGEVVSDVIEIPPGSFFYAVDTEGNSIGIFEYK